MKRQAYQHPELRDENDNIIQQGAFGKNTALANSTNAGWIDYVANDLEALHDNINGAMKYAGQVNNFSDLSDMTKNTGDVWNIVNADTANGIKAGDNVVWNGTDWDNLSGTVDLSIYAEKTDYQKTIISATANGATITFNHKDGTTSTATVNNVASATAATKLQTARTISLTGDATGSANFDGSGNVSINTTVSQATVADVVHKAIQPRGVSGNENYIFYGTLTIPQNGNFFKLEVLGGSRYSSEVDQSREGTLYFRTGNGNPANYAAYSEYHRNGASELEFFVVKDSGTQYRIYSGRTIHTGTMQVIPYVGKNSSFELALTTVSALPDGAVEVEQQQIIYANTVNNYALPKGGTAVKATADAAGNNIQNTYAKKTDLDVQVSAAVPTGVVQAFAGRTTPQGWLLCDGSAVSRSAYAALYAVIGTTYGAGNGSTTFNLPNLIDKFVEGSATAGTVKSAGLPNITGVFQTRYPWATAADNAAGAFASPPATVATPIQAAGTEQINHNIVSFSANKSNSIYGNSTTVQPPALTMRYIIKY